MYWEVWDRESRNMLGDFPTREEALAFVAEEIEEAGPQAISHWFVAPGEGDGASIEGGDLLQQAQDVAGARLSIARLALRLANAEERIHELEEQVQHLHAEVGQRVHASS